MLKIGQLLLLSGVLVSSAFAGSIQAPEIDAASGAAAVALLSGGILVLRSRRKQ